jgi:hypothetical protein
LTRFLPDEEVLRDKSSLYIGRAGQLLVMSEFLLRGWNAALPEVDVGDDVFVVKDESGDLSRIQVKTAISKPSGGAYTAQFAVGLSQPKTPRNPDLIYVFTVRHGPNWGPYLIIPREKLRQEHEFHHIGSASMERLILRFVYEPDRARCGTRDLSAFLNDWTKWPVIRDRAKPANSIR